MLNMDTTSFAGKKALVRVDLNVPQDVNGKVTDDSRARAIVRTVNKILSDGGSAILMSHLGRPKGKVNPVMSEAVLQVCARVIGNDATITWAAAQLSNFELNVGMPVIAHAMLESIRLLTNVVELFRKRCIEGIVAKKERCAELIEYSMAMVTSLVPIIGYDLSAEIAKESAKTGKTVRQICREKKVLPEDQLAAALDPADMTKPGGEGAAGG